MESSTNWKLVICHSPKPGRFEIIYLLEAETTAPNMMAKTIPDTVAQIPLSRGIFPEFLTSKMSPLKESLTENSLLDWEEMKETLAWMKLCPLCVANNFNESFIIILTTVSQWLNKAIERRNLIYGWQTRIQKRSNCR